MNAAELALLRASASTDDLMPDTADVVRPSETDTESGGSTTTETTVLTGVKCRLEPGGLSPDENLVGARLASVLAWTIAFPHGTDVDHKDRIVVPSGGGAGSQTFEVQAVLKGGSFELERRVAATEVRR